MDKELMLDVGQANEIKLAARRNGWTNAHIKTLSEGDMMARILPVVCGYGEVHIIAMPLDCSKPFDPAGFIGPNWKKDGSSDHDDRCLTLTEVDFAKVGFETCLSDGESPIKGEEKLRRLKAKDKEQIRLGGNQFLALWEDYQARKENSVLEWLRKNKGIMYLDFPGLILLGPNDNRYVLYLYWLGSKWNGVYGWLGHDWHVRDHSVVLAGLDLGT